MGYIKDFQTAQFYDVGIAVIDLENVEPSIEGFEYDDDQSENDIELKPMEKIPESLIDSIAEVDFNFSIEDNCAVHIPGFPFSGKAK